MRNIVPVLGIFTSAITNFLMTRRLGNTVRRYMRYQHALDAEIQPRDNSPQWIDHR